MAVDFAVLAPKFQFSHLEHTFFSASKKCEADNGECESYQKLTIEGVYNTTMISVYKWRSKSRWQTTVVFHSIPWNLNVDMFPSVDIIHDLVPIGMSQLGINPPCLTSCNQSLLNQSFCESHFPTSTAVVEEKLMTTDRDFPYNLAIQIKFVAKNDNFNRFWVSILLVATRIIRAKFKLHVHYFFLAFLLCYRWFWKLSDPKLGGIGRKISVWTLEPVYSAGMSWLGGSENKASGDPLACDRHKLGLECFFTIHTNTNVDIQIKSKLWYLHTYHINISNVKPKQKTGIFTHISTSTGIHQSIDESRDVWMFFLFSGVYHLNRPRVYFFPGLTI